MDPIEIPEDLTSLSGEALATLSSQVVTAATELRASHANPEEFSDDEVAEMERLAAATQRIAEASQARQAEAATRAQRFAAATAVLDTPPVTASTSTEEPPAEPPTEPATPPADPPAEPTDPPAETPPVTASAQTVNINVSRDELVKETAAQVLAGLGRGSAKPNVPAVVPPKASGRASLVAAAQIGASTLNGGKGWNAGAEFADFSELADAFEAHASRVIPRTHVKGAPQQGFSFGQIRRGVEAFQGFTTDNRDFKTDLELLDAVAKSGADSLLAAGGWCAPSETLYDLCAIESLDGLIDLPEIQVNRGGINFTTGPDFSAIYATAGFCQTEAEAIAGDPKACVEVPCPDFEEVRLDACGLCVRAPILMNAGFPELVRRWIEGTFIAHQHKVAGRIIASMRTQLAAAAQTAADYYGSAASTLNAIELAIEGQKQKWRMSRNAVMEVVAPVWLMANIRADLALRNGRQTEDVSDEEIQAHFRRRKANVQWVYNYQDLTFPDVDPGAPVVPGCAVAYPATVEVMIYPAGTFVKGTTDVINLETVYDTAGLQANMYTAAFFEEGVLVAKRCFDGCRLSIPLCASGKTGAANIDLCEQPAA